MCLKPSRGVKVASLVSVSSGVELPNVGGRWLNGDGRLLFNRLWSGMHSMSGSRSASMLISLSSRCDRVYSTPWLRGSRGADTAHGLPC